MSKMYFGKNEKVEGSESMSNLHNYTLAVISGVSIGLFYNQVKIWNRMNALDSGLRVNFNNQVVLSETIMEILNETNE